MPVALDMGQPEQVDQCEVLLHGEPGLGGEILLTEIVLVIVPAFHIQQRAALRMDL